MLTIAIAALAAGATASPTISAPTPPVAATVPAETPNHASSAKPDLAQMLVMFDRMFPAQPEPDPARLALARTTVEGILPAGSYGQMLGDMMSGLFERMLEMKESDLGTRPGAGGKPEQTLRQKLIAEDPHFEERMRLTRAAATSEFLKLSASVEPRLRDGLARAVARRFDQRQLTDINRFFATDSGRALGSQMLRLWIDPDIMRSVMAGLPEMVAAMPAVLVRVEAATAHLPKPAKKAARPPAKAPAQRGK